MNIFKSLLMFYFIIKQKRNGIEQCLLPGCVDGGVGGITPPIFSHLPESWSRVSHAAREWVASLLERSGSYLGTILNYCSNNAKVIRRAAF